MSLPPMSCDQDHRVEAIERVDVGRGGVAVGGQKSQTSAVAPRELGVSQASMASGSRVRHGCSHGGLRRNREACVLEQYGRGACPLERAAATRRLQGQSAPAAASPSLAALWPASPPQPLFPGRRLQPVLDVPQPIRSLMITWRTPLPWSETPACGSRFDTMVKRLAGPEAGRPRRLATPQSALIDTNGSYGRLQHTANWVDLCRHSAPKFFRPAPTRRTREDPSRHVPVRQHQRSQTLPSPGCSVAGRGGGVAVDERG